MQGNFYQPQSIPPPQQQEQYPLQQQYPQQQQQQYPQQQHYPQQQQQHSQQHRSLNDFLGQYGQYHHQRMGMAPHSAPKFEAANGRILCCHLHNEHIWIKLGSMIAYNNGQVSFSRETIRDQGLIRTIKEGITKEGMELVKAQTKGTADLYLADEGKRVIHMCLQHGEAVLVNGDDVLAFENSVRWDIARNKSIAGIMQGGMFNVKLAGPGWICVTTHFDPLVLHVRAGQPIFTDPDNTVMWSANLKTSFKTDIKFKSILGSKFKSGEEVRILRQQAVPSQVTHSFTSSSSIIAACSGSGSGSGSGSSACAVSNEVRRRRVRRDPAGRGMIPAIITIHIHVV